MVKIRISKLSTTQVIAVGYLAIIFFGGLLLSLPISSKSGTYTSYINALFTSVSATCVTGLVIYDTFSYWSLFGQLVILSLIQIGGLGFMAIVTLFSMFLKRRIGLKERRLLMESANTIRIGGVVLLIKKILIGTFVIEIVGALLLSTSFVPQMGLGEGLYNAVFHSISAFCNAGFDIMGKFGPFSSLTTYSEDIVVNLTVTSLIIIGGIGFLVWDDASKYLFKFSKYQLHSKIVLSATVILLLSGTVLFYIFEYDHSLSHLNAFGKMLASLFQAVTPRTAGFNTVDIAALSESGSLLTMVLMAIGGSPGSTAGGIKTTTLVVLVLGIISSAKQTPDLCIFKRKLEDNALKRASAIASIYFLAAVVSVMIICATQAFSLKQVLFEVLSASGTVGLTTGITPELNSLSKIIIMFLMYGGRVGGLSMALVLAEKRESIPIKRPVEKIIIG